MVFFGALVLAPPSAFAGVGAGALAPVEGVGSPFFLPLPCLLRGTSVYSVDSGAPLLAGEGFAAGAVALVAFGALLAPLATTAA